VERQKIITSDAVDRDVIGMARGFNETNIHIFFVRQGKLIDRQAFILGGTDELSRPEIMSIFIKQFYTRAAYIPPEILTSDPVDEIELIESWLSGKRGMRVHLRTPQRGEKKALADMAAENALLAMEQKAKLIEARTDRALLATLRLAEALNMDVPINRVEAYDISNIQGKQSVASMVVFEEGKPAKDQYRHFRIKTVEGPDDFASMKEVIHRRFKRGLEEKKQCLQTGFARMPDLVVIDGGKGQLAAAVEAMTELGTNNIPTIGLAEKHEHIFKFGEPEPLVLPRDSEALLLLQQIRDEAHRFAVAYHRKLRGKAAIVSVLDGIPGIGKVRRKALLRAFGSVEEIRKASIDEIRDVPGMDSRAAQSVYDYFRRHTI
jgi:excinuclease ABC subunit C